MYGDGMKQRTVLIMVEVLGGVVACIGVAMFNPAMALITAGTLIVVACEANS